LGGALYIDELVSEVLIKHSKFDSNVAETGGAIYFGGDILEDDLEYEI